MNTIVEPIEISFGDKLRKTRESLNLSLEDVAKATSLRPNILEKLENNEFVQKNVPATFLKGYLRSYTKFLRIPESEWANLDFGEVPKNDLDKNMRTMRSVNQYAPHGRWVGLLTSLVLLIVVGMTALWWWQNYQKSNEERDNLVQTYVEKEKTAELPATHSNEIPVTVNSQPAVSNNETASVAEKTNNAAEPAVSTTQENQAQPVNAEVSTAATSAPTVEQAQAPVVEQTLPNTEPTTEQTVPDTQSAVENPAISEAPTTAKGDLVIEITKNSSWISVKDQNRKVLAQKEYKQGEVLTFNGNDYALIIGAPGNVRITYKGEAYPLIVDGRVAKFKLPKP